MIDKSTIPIAEFILRERFLINNPEIIQISRHILHIKNKASTFDRMMFICPEKKKDNFLLSIVRYPQYMKLLCNLHNNELNRETDIRTIFRYFSKIKIRKVKFYYFLM